MDDHQAACPFCGGHDLRIIKEVREGKQWIDTICQSCDPPRRIPLQDFRDKVRENRRNDPS
jgi:hypothetical protein